MSDPTSSHSSQRLYKRVLDVTVALYRVTDYFPKAEILRNHLRSKANEIFERVIESSNTLECDSETNLLTQKIRTIKGYLTIAGTLNYVRPINLMILEKEYGLIEESLEQKKTELIQYPLSKAVRRIEREDAFHSFNPEDDASHVSDEHLNNKLPIEMTHGTADVVDVMQETGKIDSTFHKRRGGEMNDRQKVLVTHIKQRGNAKISDFYASFDDISSKTIQRDLQGLVDMKILKKEGEKRWTTYSFISDE